MLDAIDDKRGTVTRSAFVRECLAKYLGLDAVFAAAPDRTGKGGRPKASAIHSQSPAKKTKSA